MILKIFQFFQTFKRDNKWGFLLGFHPERELFLGNPKPFMGIMVFKKGSSSVHSVPPGKKGKFRINKLGLRGQPSTPFPGFRGAIFLHGAPLIWAQGDGSSLKPAFKTIRGSFGNKVKKGGSKFWAKWV
ncbi:MAG: hypothetical protein CM15mP58_13760 [Burkholderiaceae bacterium]|nr:MAG: hypothetical protein CM15mP58_13760 [Burkholderiaceae bacterium]